jgi:hypothetical protein
VAIVAVLVVLGLAAYGIQMLFNRPGEKALKLVPAGSAFFMSIDLAPSPNQVATFNEIGDALKKSGVDDKIKEGLTSMVKMDPVTRSVAPYVAHGGALASLPGTAIEKTDGFSGVFGSENMACILGLTDPGAAEKSLSNNAASLETQGLRYWPLLHSGGDVAVISGNLVIASKPGRLLQIARVASGATQSVIDTADYKAAREKLDADSNVMVFVAKGAFEGMPGMMTPGSKGTAWLNGLNWVAYGLAVRDSGIALSMAEGVDTSQAKWLAEAAKAPSLRKDLFNVLPSGAFGAVATSGVAAYLKAAKEGLGGYENGKMLHDMERELRKAADLDVDTDLIPALRGDAVFAVYPGAGKNHTPDFLAVIDDQNGGDPSAVVPKLRALASKNWKEEHHNAELFEPTEVAGVQGYRMSDAAVKEGEASARANRQTFGMANGPIDEQGQKELNDEMSKLMKKQQEAFDAQRLHPNALAPKFDFQAEYKKAVEKAEADTKARQKGTDTDEAALSESATDAYYAVVGKAVIVASSKRMMERAVNAYRLGQDSMGADPMFGKVSAQLSSHSVLMFASFSRIASEIEKAMPSGESMPKAARAMFDLFESNPEPMVMSSQLDGQLWSGTGFIPLKVAKFVEISAEVAKEADDQMKKMRSQQSGA